MPVQLITLVFSLGLAVLTVYLMVTGRDLFIPLVIAGIVWYIINALTRTYQRLSLGGWAMPRWLGLTGALLTVLVALGFLADMIGNSLAGVTQAAPQYQANFEKLIEQAAHAFGLSHTPTFAQIFEEFDAKNLMLKFGTAAAGVAGNAGIILIYVMFLLIEQQSFDKKLKAIFPDPEKEKNARELLGRMQGDIQTYISIKTVVSLLTGVVSYVILKTVGVDFAEFWAFLIFLLNYIPTVGSIVAVLFPTLLALVQFPSLVPFIIVGVGLGVTQFLVGNVLEPRLMGSSLNISPLVVIFSLALWGSIWGVAGMFLCVPITVILMIILAQFRQTRPIALALSSDGNLKT